VPTEGQSTFHKFLHSSP